MTVDNQQRLKKQQVSHHEGVADLVGDGRVDLYAGFRSSGILTACCPMRNTSECLPRHG